MSVIWTMKKNENEKIKKKIILFFSVGVFVFLVLKISEI